MAMVMQAGNAVTADSERPEWHLFVNCQASLLGSDVFALDETKSGLEPRSMNELKQDYLDAKTPYILCEKPSSLKANWQK
jgi:hypothetical protein